MKDISLFKSTLPAALAALITAASLSGSARTVNVAVAVGNALTFSPAVTNIATGDTVIWIWDNNSNLHSTTDTGLWDSGLKAEPFSFTNTFNTPGNFPYVCTRHAALGMTGEVIVATAALPPTLAITTPIAGAVFAAPAMVTLQVAVTNGSTAVTNVEFLVGAGLVANVATPPFAAVTGALAAGSYLLTAIAADHNGLQATNSIAISVVDPVPVSLAAPRVSAPSGFQFSYSANVGLKYVVQRSTNLLATNWLAIATNTAVASPASFSDPAATGSPGFYRVVRLPNP